LRLPLNEWWCRFRLDERSVDNDGGPGPCQRFVRVLQVVAFVV